jgi:hypothetical protein
MVLMISYNIKDNKIHIHNSKTGESMRLEGSDLSDLCDLTGHLLIKAFMGELNK